jgi:hypothetical protein
VLDYILDILYLCDCTIERESQYEILHVIMFHVSLPLGGNCPLNNMFDCFSIHYELLIVQCVRKVSVHLQKVLEVTERTIVSKNWIKQLHTLLVLHFNYCLTTEYSETTAHFNGNFDTDNQIYVL